MVKKAFVTGAGGFIGSNLVKELLSRGYIVSALIKKWPAGIDSHDNLQIVHGDILDEGLMLKAMQGVDLLFHCAAYISFSSKDLERSYAINVSGTKNVLEAAMRNKVKKVVYVSGASTLGYAKALGQVIDEKSIKSVLSHTPYAYTKKLAEDIAREYAQKGMDISIAHSVTVYGTGDRKMNSGSVIKSVYKNKILLIPPGGTSYINIHDLVIGLILASERGSGGESYIFCSENLTYAELFGRIAKALQKKPLQYVLPRWTLLFLLGALKFKDLFMKGNRNSVNVVTPEIAREVYFYKYYNSRKAANELGWKPRFFLEESVKEALDFYHKEGLL